MVFNQNKMIIDYKYFELVIISFIPSASMTTKPPAPAKLYRRGRLSNKDSIKGCPR